MNERNNDSDESEAFGVSNGDRGSHGQSVSRRRVLRSSAGAAALALGFGASGSAAAAPSVERQGCNSGDSIRVGNGEGMVINNDWSVSVDGNGADGCVYRYDDGSYGWDWERYSTDACAECPNYTEVLIGTKPFGSQTNQPLFPVQRGDVEQLELDLDVEVDADHEEGEWNLALEWWLTPNRPPGSPTHETMIVLEKSDAHTKGGSIEEGAVTDKYGNTYDYWEEPDHVEWDDFHIFKIAANEPPSNLDLMPIIEYLNQEVDSEFPDEYWMSGIEIGNEYWDNTSGQTRFANLDVRMNGQTATTGVDSEFTEEPSDGTAPSTPSGLDVSTTTENLTVSWDPASDSGGSGLDHYEVSVDDRSTTVPAGTTQASITGLSPDTSYDVSVAAVDGAGNRSDPATTVARTDSTGPDVEPIDGTTPQDVDGDGEFEDLNANGDVDFDDVVTYFEHMDDPVMTDHVAAYDYNGNTEVDYADLVELFGEVE